MQQILKDIKSYINEKGSDRQLLAIVQVAKARLYIKKTGNFEKSCRIVASVVRAIADEKTLDIYDIQILALTAYTTDNLSLVNYLIERIEPILEDEAIKNPRVNLIREELYYNFTYSLFVMNYKSWKNPNPDNALKQLFIFYVEKAIKLALDTNYMLHYDVLLLRQALFLKNMSGVNKQLKIITESKDEGYIELANREANEYKAVVHGELDEKAFIKQVADNIKVQRVINGLSVERLSELTGISVSSLAQMERGERNIYIGKLYTISKVLGIDLDVLMRIKDTSYKEQKDMLLNDVFTSASSLSIDKLECLVNIIAVMKQYLADRRYC